MIEFPEEMKKCKYDVLFFLPGTEEETIHLEQQVYKKPGKKLDGSALGDSYHIVLFKIRESEMVDLDNFDAILIDPFTYISQLIPQNWYGFVAKKTTTSNKFLKSTLDNLSSL
jgi:hypothetical protein